MKDWWMNLSLRERQVLTIGGFFVGLFLLYEIIWAPLTNSVINLRRQVQENSSLLNWMKQADQRVQTLLQKPSQTSNSTASLLSTVQTQVNKSPLGTHVTQLRQSESDTVKLTLNAVDFDQLVVWLTQLGKSNGVIVGQITVNPAGGPGVVATDILLKSDRLSS